MKTKKTLITLFAFLMPIFIFLYFTVSTTSIASAESIYNVEDKVVKFLDKIYNLKECKIDNQNIVSSTELYDENDEVIATAVIVENNNKIDYAIYNHLTDSIDEYGFDCPEIEQKFNSKNKTYYAGALNYYSEVGNTIRDSASRIITHNDLFKRIKSFKINAQNRIKQLSGDSPTNGSNGIINWKDIVTKNSDCEVIDYGYLEGISSGMPKVTNGISSGTAQFPNGITGRGLYFSSMSDFNANGNLTNHCGPTALTNIMVYYNWIGKNTLLNGSRQDTFDRLRILCKHDINNTTFMSDARSAIITYLSERGYSATLNNFNDDFNSLKSVIKANQIVLTLLNVTQADGYKWGHFVVTLGYEEFRQAYQQEHQFLWWKWTTTEYNYLCYIRVCDGWNTSNSNQYVDMNSFYDSYTNSAIVLN